MNFNQDDFNQNKMLDVICDTTFYLGRHEKVSLIPVAF